MIQVVPIHYDIPEGTVHIRSHILHPRTSITIILGIQGEKDHILSVLEDHLLETISSTEWTHEESDQDFTFLTEHYNRFIKNLDSEDLDGVSVALWLLKGNHIILSTIGNACAVLVEHEEVSKITSGEKQKIDFHSLTSGDISRDTTIFFSNSDIISALGEGVLVELSELKGEEFESAAYSIIARELHTPLHLVRIAQKQYHSDNQEKRWKQRSIMPRKAAQLPTYIKNHQIITALRKKIHNTSLHNNQTARYIFLGTGAMIIMLLLYTFFRGLSMGITQVSDESKEKILTARTLIEESQKLKNNPTAFNAKIQEAREILFWLRNEQKYLTDTQELLGRIEALQKEAYDIQTIDLPKREVAVAGEANGLHPILTLSVNNKLIVAGDKKILTSYVPWTPIDTLIDYPQGDEAVSMDITDKGTPYILSKGKKLYTLNAQNVVIPVITGGKDTWEAGSAIHIYNNHIYLLSESGDQIYKYKPSGNGFASKTNVFSDVLSNKILDFSIDGGYYLLLEDGKIGRYISTKNTGIEGLTLNRIPEGTWNIDSTQKSQIIGTERLSYVYIRNGKRLWVFQPNSRRYQDITALEYIAQLELQSPDEIRDISIPRDGTFLISTSHNVYSVQFEIVDGKLVLK